MIKKIPADEIPCKFANHYTDQVPVPFGSGNCSMPGFVCEYNGDKQIPEDMVCRESAECPAYKPVPIHLCVRHQEEYFEYCVACEGERWKENK